MHLWVSVLNQGLDTFTNAGSLNVSPEKPISWLVLSAQVVRQQLSRLRQWTTVCDYGKGFSWPVT